MTFLEAVNEVQRLLRETVSSSTNQTAYSRLLALLVNKAKRMVEDAYDWSELKTELSITTVNGTSVYSLTGSGPRFRIIRDADDLPYIYNTSSKYRITSIADSAEIRFLQGTTDDGGQSPDTIGFEGVDSSGDLKVVLWPTPSSAESIKFYGIVPQDDFDITGNTDDATQISVPGQLVTLLAWAMAIAERGEDASYDVTEVYQFYLQAQSDILAYRENLSGDTHKDATVI